MAIWIDFDQKWSTFAKSMRKLVPIITHGKFLHYRPSTVYAHAIRACLNRTNLDTATSVVQCYSPSMRALCCR